jgi:hypothetical protein
MTTFHHASADSERIQRVVNALRRAGDAGLTPIQLNDLCGSTRASSDVSEARAAGFNIFCQYVGKSESGRKVHRYHLVPAEQVAAMREKVCAALAATQPAKFGVPASQWEEMAHYTDAEQLEHWGTTRARLMEVAMTAPKGGQMELGDELVPFTPK